MARLLGRGGMGAVYLCEDERLAGKLWAIKEMMCYDPVMIEEATRNFEREANILAGLRHRSLPMIVDYFSESGRSYVVMELVEGATLSRVVEEEGPLSEILAMRWALEIAQVLEYLHRQSPPIIFRDLKPENIMVTSSLSGPAGDGRHVKLIDFGLARHFDPDKRRDTQASGSVGYAAPEQWEDSQQTDPRSDIYSLGGTLYYVLTGKPPSPIYGSHRIRPYRKDIGPDTEALVLRCLQPDPAQRYQDTQELIRDLLLILARLGESHPDTPAPRPVAPVPLPEEEAPRPRAGSAAPRWLGNLMVGATVLFLLAAVTSLAGLRGPPRPSPSPTVVAAEDKARALELMRQGSPAQAIEVLDGVVTRRPSDAEAHILKQNALAQLIGRPMIRLPVLTSVTGSDGAEGFSLLYGIALAQAEVNQAGGPGSRSLVVDIYDDQSQLPRALALAQEIAERADYLVCIGPFNSQFTLGVAPLFNNAGLPMIAPVASDPRIWEAGPYCFTGSDSNRARGEVLARHFLAQGLKRGAIVYDPNSLYSITMAEEFADFLGSEGGQVACRVEDVAQVAQSQPQFVFLADYRSGPILEQLRALREAGVQAPVACQARLFGPEVAAAPEAEGLLLSSYFHPDVREPRVADFARRFRQMFGEISPSHREATAYDVTMLVLPALDRPHATRLNIRDYLAGLTSYEGVTGEFAPGQRLDRRKAYVVEVHEGKYRLLP